MGIFSLLLKFRQIVSELAWEAELQFGPLMVQNNSESIWAEVFFFFFFLIYLWDFPAGPVVRMLSSQSKAPRFDPRSGN